MKDLTEKEHITEFQRELQRTRGQAESVIYINTAFKNALNRGWKIMTKWLRKNHGNSLDYAGAAADLCLNHNRAGLELLQDTGLITLAGIVEKLPEDISDFEAVDLLLDSWGETNFSSYPIFTSSIHRFAENTEFFKHLYSRGVRIKYLDQLNALLYSAFEKGNTKLIRFLIRYPEDHKYNIFILWACRIGNFEYARHLLSQPDKILCHKCYYCEVIRSLIYKKNYEAVKLLFEYPNYINNTCLVHCIALAQKEDEQILGVILAVPAFRSNYLNWLCDFEIFGDYCNDTVFQDLIQELTSDFPPGWENIDFTKPDSLQCLAIKKLLVKKRERYPEIFLAPF